MEEVWMSGFSNRRLRRALVAGVTASAVVASIVVIDGAPGAAAADKPLAQSVGRFLDGSVGGNPLQQLADVKDARAVNPGTTSAQNPLDATLLGKLELPLSGALQLPGGGVFTLGAVNQVAQAKSDGSAYGASGAVSNSGGISLGGSSEFPADATIDLSDAALGSLPIPGLPGLPGSGTSADALGGVHAVIGAVSGLAQTKTGGDPVTPEYQIAGLALKLDSPLLAALLQQLVNGGKALQGLLSQVLAALGAAGITVPTACTVTLTTLPPPISLDKGAVVVDAAKATVTIDLEKLLEQLGLDLNKLPANTDLLAYVLGNLGRILSHGLENVIDGLINPIKATGTACLTAITGLPGIGGILGNLLTTLQAGEPKLEQALNSVADKLSSAGAPGLKLLTDNLAKVAAIGVNVESGPGKAADNTKYKFTSALKPTPDQATPAVADQTLVRAIEIDVLGGQLAALALGNAAAGPSTPAVAPPSSSTPVPTTTVPGTAIPTGVPAGQAQTGGTPTLPLVLLVLGLLMAAGGAATWRLRGGKHAG
jgi:hypothetical protein